MTKLLRMIRRYEAVCVFLIVALMFGIKPPMTHAQDDERPVTAMEYPAVNAYLTDHPLDPTLLILATPDGRYAIAPQDGCDQFGAMQPVLFYRDADGEQYIFQPRLSPHDPSEYNCHITVIAQVDATPCFSNPESGYCDVRQEQDYTGQ
jgi:hypothetical protein